MEEKTMPEPRMEDIKECSQLKRNCTLKITNELKNRIKMSIVVHTCNLSESRVSRMAEIGGW
jgi:hypothetical protein